MVTLQTAENALKTVYLGAVTELLNTKSNPLLSEIEQTSADVWGKEIKTAARAGINGGVGAGDEAGSLPAPDSSQYVQFTSTLKNLYGQIEISDKAIRASAGGQGAFTDILNAELEALLTASKFNLGRMLYGDGTGCLGGVVSGDGTNFVVTNVENFIEGMRVDAYMEGEKIFENLRIARVIPDQNTIVPSKDKYPNLDELAGDVFLYVQGSKDKEITGIGALFNPNMPIYGNPRNKVPFLVPYSKDNVGALDEVTMQMAIDRVENVAGSTVNYIACSADAKYAYQEYMAQYKKNIDVMELKGGYKTMSYNGIPLVYDRFVKKGTMYMLDTTDFKMYQLCDWQFLENENGKILRQSQGKPTYTATLVKYCDLICRRPNGQARLSGITR